MTKRAFGARRLIWSSIELQAKSWLIDRNGRDLLSLDLWDVEIPTIRYTPKSNQTNQKTIVNNEMIWRFKYSKKHIMIQIKILNDINVSSSLLLKDKSKIEGFRLQQQQKQQLLSRLLPSRKPRCRFKSLEWLVFVWNHSNRKKGLIIDIRNGFKTRKKERKRRDAPTKANWCLSCDKEHPQHPADKIISWKRSDFFQVAASATFATFATFLTVGWRSSERN